MKLREHYVFNNNMIFSYNNEQINPNATVHYLKAQKAWVFNKNQSSSHTKGFMRGLVTKTLVTCERVANIFLHQGTDFAYMQN